MEHIARLIQGTLNALELVPEEVNEVEIESSGFTIWNVLMNGTYAFFNMNGRNPYEPYTTVTPDEVNAGENE